MFSTALFDDGAVVVISSDGVGGGKDDAMVVVAVLVFLFVVMVLPKVLYVASCLHSGSSFRGLVHGDAQCTRDSLFGLHNDNVGVDASGGHESVSREDGRWRSCHFECVSENDQRVYKDECR